MEDSRNTEGNRNRNHKDNNMDSQTVGYTRIRSC